MTNHCEVLIEDNKIKKSGLSYLFNCISEFFHSYPIHEACKQGEVNKLTKLLSQLKDKTQINFTDDLGNTALFYTIEKISL